MLAMRSHGYSIASHCPRLNTLIKAPWRKSGEAAVVELPGGEALQGLIAWLTSLGIHLCLLSGAEEKTSVFVDWGWNLITDKRGKRMILNDEDMAAKYLGRAFTLQSAAICHAYLQHATRFAQFRSKHYSQNSTGTHEQNSHDREPVQFVVPQRQ